MLILTSEQIYHITQKKRYQAQAAALNAIGIVHKQRPDGSLVVSTAHVQQVLGYLPDTTETKAVAPNWDLIDA